MKERKKEEEEGTLVKRSSSRSARRVVFPYYSLLSLLFLQGKTTHITLQSLVLLLHLPSFLLFLSHTSNSFPKKQKQRKSRKAYTPPLHFHLHARTQLCGCARCSRALISLRRPTTDRRGLWTHTEKAGEGKLFVENDDKTGTRWGGVRGTSLLSVLLEEGEILITLYGQDLCHWSASSRRSLLLFLRSFFSFASSSFFAFCFFPSKKAGREKRRVPVRETKRESESGLHFQTVKGFLMETRRERNWNACPHTHARARELGFSVICCSGPRGKFCIGKNTGHTETLVSSEYASCNKRMEK